MTRSLEEKLFVEAGQIAINALNYYATTSNLIMRAVGNFIADCPESEYSLNGTRITLDQAQKFLTAPTNSMLQHMQANAPLNVATSIVTEYMSYALLPLASSHPNIKRETLSYIAIVFVLTILATPIPNDLFPTLQQTCYQPTRKTVSVQVCKDSVNAWKKVAAVAISNIDKTRVVALLKKYSANKTDVVFSEVAAAMGITDLVDTEDVQSKVAVVVNKNTTCRIVKGVVTVGGIVGVGALLWYLIYKKK